MFTTDGIVTVPRMETVTVPTVYTEENGGEDYGVQVWIGLSLGFVITLLLVCVCIRRNC